MKDEIETDAEELMIKNVGKQDPKKRLTVRSQPDIGIWPAAPHCICLVQDEVDRMMASNIGQCLGAMIDTIVF